MNADAATVVVIIVSVLAAVALFQGIADAAVRARQHRRLEHKKRPRLK